jgi:hypothetical protein
MCFGSSNRWDLNYQKEKPFKVVGHYLPAPANIFELVPDLLRCMSLHMAPEPKSALAIGMSAYGGTKACAGFDRRC